MSNVKAIFDADDAVAGQFPYHVAILVWRNTTAENIRSFNTWPCSGAIINSKSVITSFKCVSRYNFNGLWAGTDFRIKTDCLHYMDDTCTEYTTNIAPKTTRKRLIALIKVPSDQEISFNDLSSYTSKL